MERPGVGITHLRADRHDGNSGRGRPVHPALGDDGIERHEHDAVDPLGQQIVEVVRLLLHLALRIEHDRLHARARGLLLESLRDGGGEGIAEPGAREPETQRGAVRRARSGGCGEPRHCRKCQERCHRRRARAHDMLPGGTIMARTRGAPRDRGARTPGPPLHADWRSRPPRPRRHASCAWDDRGAR